MKLADKVIFNAFMGCVNLFNLSYAFGMGPTIWGTDSFIPMAVIPLCIVATVVTFMRVGFYYHELEGEEK